MTAADFLNILWGGLYTFKAAHDKISGFRRRVFEVFTLQGRYTSSVENCLPTFRYKTNNYQQTLRNDPEDRRHDVGDFVRVYQILFYRQI